MARRRKASHICGKKETEDGVYLIISYPNRKHGRAAGMPSPLAVQASFVAGEACSHLVTRPSAEIFVFKGVAPTKTGPTAVWLYTTATCPSYTPSPIWALGCTSDHRHRP
jgi:hypothetical protein